MNADVAARLEGEIAELCGLINAATGRLVSLLGQVLDTGAWEGAGVLSPSHWVAWRYGVSSARARSLVAMASRLDELPATRAALEAGALSEDQAKVVCRHAPTDTDAEVAQFAQQATLSQLTRTLARYAWAPPPAMVPAEDTGIAVAEEVRSVSFGSDDDGTWRMTTRLPTDEGALVEQALVERRDALFHSGEGDGARVSWADAVVAMAEASLAGAAAARPHRERPSGAGPPAHRRWQPPPRRAGPARRPGPPAQLRRVGQAGMGNQRRGRQCGAGASHCSDPHADRGGEPGPALPGAGL